jgi:hypothetical protein
MVLQFHTVLIQLTKAFVGEAIVLVIEFNRTWLAQLQMIDPASGKMCEPRLQFKRVIESVGRREPDHSILKDIHPFF